MKTKFILLILLLSSCSLFKKTTKSSSANSFDLTKHTEERQLDLKTKQKETQVYSYWKDSALYQYELVKEQVDEVIMGNVKVQEKQEARQEQTVKESMLINGWIYVGMALGLLILYCWMKNKV